ncbi:hypothetical protein D1BOALGB6SA_6809 [Olavius sp. associated proteobacterium Delta 1]|nr:hypothetical protein D1BOALGB6SA_6809 [Olavius sp. associated proteobacterium Delta 1]
MLTIDGELPIFLDLGQLKNILTNITCHYMNTVLDDPPPTKGALKNNFTFYTSMHPVRLRCESPEYLDIPARSRLASRALQRLKL